MAKRTAEDRFRAFVVVREDGCWCWQGNKGWQGYGQFWFDGRNVRAHRWAYEHWVAAIPEGLTIDHLCRTRSCVNPAHLEPVTPRENVLRGDTVSARNASKARCVNGHPLAGQNLYVDPRGRRECRTCRRKATERYQRQLGVKVRQPIDSCPRGHKYTPENTYSKPGTSWHECRECRRLRRLNHKE